MPAKLNYTLTRHPLLSLHAWWKNNEEKTHGEHSAINLSFLWKIKIKTHGSTCSVSLYFFLHVRIGNQFPSSFMALFVYCLPTICGLLFKTRKMQSRRVSFDI